MKAKHLFLSKKIVGECICVLTVGLAVDLAALVTEILSTWLSVQNLKCLVSNLKSQTGF